MSPPGVPKAAPARKPIRRPTRAIHIEVGTVAIAVPRNIDAIGAVAQSGEGASVAPAGPPIVMTSTEAVWNSACAEAGTTTCQYIGVARGSVCHQNTRTFSAATVAAASSSIVLRRAPSMTSASLSPRASMQDPQSRTFPPLDRKRFSMSSRL